MYYNFGTVIRDQIQMEVGQRPGMSWRNGGVVKVRG